MRGQEYLLAIAFILVMPVGPAHAEDYPVGDRTSMWTEPMKYRIGSFRHMDRIYFAHEVNRGGPVSVLPHGDEIDHLTYRWQGKKRKIDEYFEAANTTGLLVLKDGEIVYEHYGMGADEHSLLTSWSMAKSFTSTLVGFALGDGLIRDVDDPISDYVTDLKGSGFDGVPIKAVLQMSSGVDFSDDYNDPNADSSRMWDQTIGGNLLPITEFVRAAGRAHPPFEKFAYSSLDAQALGWLVSKVTGKTLADYMSEKIWVPLGMESDATWNTDAEGPAANEVTFCCLNATLRDYARFGLLMMNDGIWDGKRLLPEGWVQEATHPDRPQVMPGRLFPGAEVGYQYQWWVLPERSDRLGGYEAQGVHGQVLYINPREKLVIVATSAWPKAWDDELDGQLHEIFWAFKEELH
jgi:CubicO group peptidase (beta-lactamase class C family)